MNYVFIFLGEFGYELFNWQGVIRKLSLVKKPDDKFICCSRANLHPFYEFADQYIDISNVKSFKNSAACGYFGRHPQSDSLLCSTDVLFDVILKTEVRDYCFNELKRLGCNTEEGVQFVFSSDYYEVGSLKIGSRRDKFGIDYSHASIYEDLDVDNNLYKKIEANDELKPIIEKKLGFELNEPYILIQHRKREIVNRSQYQINYEKFIRDLSRKYKVILLSFNTERLLDSYSKFEEFENCYNIYISTFPEQALLIKYASLCIFMTEGDFGSHIYVPPFMGKDVIAIAGSSIYDIGTTPIKTWNEKVFKFGGKIYDYVAESVLDYGANYEKFLTYIFRKIDLELNLDKIEERFHQSNFDDYYLWPRTPKTFDHQDKIRERMGVDDYSDSPNSRPNMIIKKLQDLISSGVLNENFNLVDVASGDSIVLWRIKKILGKADCSGIDCLKDHFGTHKQIQEDGVKIYAGFLQHLYYEYFQTKTDVALMLNSYRGWENADLRDNEKDIPELVDRWFKCNVKYSFVTATNTQIAKLKNMGFYVDLLGKGEDNSFMICISAQ